MGEPEPAGEAADANGLETGAYEFAWLTARFVDSIVQILAVMAAAASADAVGRLCDSVGSEHLSELSIY